MLTRLASVAPPVLTPYQQSGQYGQNYLSPQPPPTRMLTPLQMCEFDPVPTVPGCAPSVLATVSPAPRTLTTHQVKNVATFTGKEKPGPRIEDWVRDMKYLLDSKGPAPDAVQFHEAVRHTGGRARDVVLNLESRAPENLSAEAVFTELLEEYGEDRCALSPVAKFYARTQRESESPTEYAIALESTLREVEEARRRRGHTSSEEGGRDRMLTTQFMYGLKDLRCKQRLAPMQPRFMSFRDVRRELHIVAEEERQEEEARRKRQTLYTMSEVTGTDPKQKSRAKGSGRQAEHRGETIPPELRDGIPPALQQLLTQQLDEMKVGQREQMEALNQVLHEQRHHGLRLMQLEDVVFQSRAQQGRQPSKPSYTGCYNCGNKQHLARNCPHRRQSTPQMHQTMSPPQIQQTTVQPGSLNGQNLRM